MYHCIYNPQYSYICFLQFLPVLVYTIWTAPSPMHAILRKKWRKLYYDVIEYAKQC